VAVSRLRVVVTLGLETGVSVDVFICLILPFQISGNDVKAFIQAIAFPLGGTPLTLNIQMTVVAGVAQDVERTAILNAVNAEAQRVFGATIPPTARIRWFGL
jgi:hypothetical protein